MTTWLPGVVPNAALGCYFFQRTAVVTKYRYVFLRLYVLFVCVRYCSEMLRLKIRYNHCLENVHRRPRLRSASTEEVKSAAFSRTAKFKKPSLIG